MLINENGMIGYFRSEDLKNNRDEIINEIIEWEIPTVETIAINFANMISKSIARNRNVCKESALKNDILDTIIFSFKVNIETIMCETDAALHNDIVHLKINDYANRCYIAADLVKEKINE